LGNAEAEAGRRTIFVAAEMAQHSKGEEAQGVADSGAEKLPAVLQVPHCCPRIMPGGRPLAWTLLPVRGDRKQKPLAPAIQAGQVQC